jgi:hypothetical protein
MKDKFSGQGWKYRKIRYLFNTGLSKEKIKDRALEFCSEAYFLKVWNHLYIDSYDNKINEIVINSAFSVNEMDYGSELPKYKFKDLNDDEKRLYYSDRHYYLMLKK